MEYRAVTLRKDIGVEALYTVHYFEYSKDFIYLGEKHDFWECVYVDRGEIIATADEREIPLSRGEILFHAPNEFHTLRANGVVAPNLVVLSFASHSPMMEEFRHRQARVGNRGRTLIAAILRESEAVFSTPLGNPGTKYMEKREEIPPGAEQLIAAYLEEFLLLLLRSERGRQQSTLHRRAESNLFSLLEEYMQENVDKRLSLADLARYADVSDSTVKAVFRSHTGTGAISYFIGLKMQAAKSYIREGNYTLTQISDLLGYDSIHYFSRQFRRFFGMSPSEYAHSVRAWEEERGN